MFAAIRRASSRVSSLAADLTELYPQFYWKSISPHVQTAIKYLNVTSKGRQWVAGLYSNVFRAEHDQQ